jgi:triphosphoribosyl-dephospho-CoA synthase
VLRQTTVADTEQLFAAIRLAGPAGLGRSAEHDVRLAARVSIREAMAEAALRDSIARQYVTDYEDIFQRALPHLADARGRLDDRRAAVTDLYLSLLATIPDSHVRRKHGERVASRVTTQAARTYRAWASGAGRAAAPDLRDLDARLKKAGVNPGTTADLTVATLFLDRLLAAPVRHAGTRHRHFLRQLHFALCGSPLVSTMSMT